MSIPKQLWGCSMSPVRDKKLIAELRSFIQKKRGMGETNLLKLDGLPIYIWFANGQHDVTWRPVSEPIVYEAALTRDDARKAT